MNNPKEELAIANILLSILAEYNRFIDENEPESAENVLDWFFSSRESFERKGYTIEVFIRTKPGEASGVIVEAGERLAAHKPTN